MDVSRRSLILGAAAAAAVAASNIPVPAKSERQWTYNFSMRGTPGMRITVLASEDGITFHEIGSSAIQEDGSCIVSFPAPSQLRYFRHQISMPERPTFDIVSMDAHFEQDVRDDVRIWGKNGVRGRDWIEHKITTPQPVERFSFRYLVDIEDRFITNMSWIGLG